MIEDVSVKFKKMSTDLRTITMTKKHQPTFTEGVMQEIIVGKKFQISWLV